MAESLILASSSPQRRKLLEGLGVTFEIVPSQYAEESHPETDPAKRSVVLAEMKAKDVAAHRPGTWVIGCDTLVVAPDGTLLEKPRDMAEAREMLRRQSGGTSVVHSGLAIIAPDGTLTTGLSSSDVVFKALTDSEIEWWIGTGLWEGRSGSFQIDGPGQLMISEIRGDWSSIVGLPVYLLGELGKKAGWPFLQA